MRPATTQPTRTRLAEVLNRKRSLSIGMIGRLHDKLGISAECLIQSSRKSGITPLRTGPRSGRNERSTRFKLTPGSKTSALASLRQGLARSAAKPSATTPQKLATDPQWRAFEGRAPCKGDKLASVCVAHAKLVLPLTIKCSQSCPTLACVPRARTRSQACCLRFLRSSRNRILCEIRAGRRQGRRGLCCRG